MTCSAKSRCGFWGAAGPAASSQQKTSCRCCTNIFYNNPVICYIHLFHLFWIPQKNTYLTWFIPYGIIMELWIWDKHGMIHISNSQSLLVGRKHQPGPNRMPRWHLPVFPWILGDSAIHQPAKISCSMVMRIDWSRT
jgi:hypothetical protein